MKRPILSSLTFAAATLFIISCAPAHGADTTDGKHFTQKPELAAAVGQPAVEPAPAATSAVPKNWVSEGPAPTWIWGADPKKNYVARKTFMGGTKGARLKTSCDNVVAIRINGQLVLQSSEWQTASEADVQKFIKPGENVLEAEITNEGGSAAFVLKMMLTAADGKTSYLVSDDSWEVANLRNPKDWAKPKVVAKYGDAPWGQVLTGGAVASNTPRDTFNLLPGFQVERLFTVPKDKLGSWVCLAVDGKGRLLASDQGGIGLCRITPPKIGSTEETKVELLDIKIDGKQVSGAQGLLWAFDSLYICCNGGPGSGLYRARDTNGDDQFDECVKLKDLRGGGEHGPHALRLSPDGKSIYVDCGNHTQPPFDRKLNAPVQTMGGVRAEQLHAELPAGMTSRIAPNWDEDLLLPRQWDGNGHATGILAPGGWIAKTDPDGKTWEMISIGYRNQYDFALNGDGEIFVYDADMEWDMGSPWYRPTRVVHATSGSEFGWRSGTGKWPPYYVDSLPQLVDIGPGSPVGVEFGYGTKFPAKYQKALFICDWTFATMYAIHMEPSGASYKAVKEEFVSRTPLPLTDVVVGADGALYFSIGGRGAQSELFRVTYVGKESTAPAERKDAKDADLRALRREIETYHVADHAAPAKAAAFLVPHLAHSDRHIRYAARVALERLPVATWQDQVLGSTDIETVITGVVGLARQADAPLQSKLLAALEKLNYSSLTENQQLELLRAYQLVFLRLGLPADADKIKLGSKFDSLFPTASNSHNQELAILMVGLSSPQAASKIVPMLTKERVATQTVAEQLLARNRGYGGNIATMLANQPDLQQYQFAFTLRNLKSGWTIDQRKTYFGWFEKARTWSGGNSYQKFLTNINNDAFANSTDIERLAIESAGIRKPYVAPELPKPKGPGREYTVADVVNLATDKLKGRDFKNGQKMFAAARCIVCHRYSGDGGATGPDLTQLAGRFNLKDLTDSIVEPSKVISDQYKATVVLTDDGKIRTGRVVNDTAEELTMVIDPENAAKIEVIKKSGIEESKPSAVSLMPKDLLKQLNENEVLDLMAYLLSRGNPRDAMFQK
ncbi:Cytochrome c [Anatilimnocola aggregata]|uniref:Cytochrome c n=1 Tax=Anatilimnocola aggregata TaxID=2528021 RepID=A0A517Y4G6_9BACT|nr:c-type cytochrome [Anatilimnocola aggregata]QDU25134.1 Cytochrome c [Anatilimnocola aggregata]